MKRRWNILLWLGFVVVLAGLLSYLPLFIRFPITRDFPWANLLLLAAGLLLLGAGLLRAFRCPQLYRGRIFGSFLALLAVAGTGTFCWGLIYHARQLPASAGAPRVGQRAPDFTLVDQDNNAVSLADLIKPQAGKPGAALLIFYRGYW